MSNARQASHGGAPTPAATARGPGRPALLFALLVALSTGAAACGGPTTVAAHPWTLALDHPAGGAGTIAVDDALFALDGGTAEAPAVLLRVDLCTGETIASTPLPAPLDGGAATALHAGDGAIVATSGEAMAWFSPSTGAVLGVAESLPCAVPTAVAATPQRVAVWCGGADVWTTTPDADAWTPVERADGEVLALSAADGRIWLVDTWTDGPDVTLRVGPIGTSSESPPSWTDTLFDTGGNVEILDGVVYGRLGGYAVAARRLPDGRRAHRIATETTGGVHLGGWYVRTQAESGRVLRMQRVTAYEADDEAPRWTTWLPMATIDARRATLANDGALLSAGGSTSLLDRADGEIVWTVTLPESDDECVTIGASAAGLVRRCTSLDRPGVVVESLRPLRRRRRSAMLATAAESGDHSLCPAPSPGRRTCVPNESSGQR